MDEWIEAAELDPKDDGLYLVYMPDRSLDRYSCQHYDHRDGWSNDFGITHWMPLPEPPQRER